MVIKFFSIIMVLLSGTVTELSAQNRSFVRFGQTVTVNEGQEVRDAVAIGGNVIVKGVVTGSAVSVGGSVILASSAVVNGDVVSVGGGIQEDAGSNVSGDIVEVGMPWKNMSTKAWAGYFIGFRILMFFGFIALALLTVALFSKQVELVSNIVITQFGRAVLWGFLGILSVIPVAIFLAITIIGIPLIPLEFVAVVILTFFGYVAVSKLVGEKIVYAVNKKKISIVWEVLIGVTVFSLVNLVPFLGWLVVSVLSLAGFGGVIEALVRAHKNRNSRKPE